MVKEITKGDLRAGAKRGKAIAERAAIHEGRRITKFKLGHNKCDIEYVRSTENSDDEWCSMNIESEPHPDLLILLNQFLPDVIEAVGLDQDLWKEGVVHSIAIKYDGESIAGATLSARCKFDDENIASVSTRFLKVIDLQVDQIRLEGLCSEICDCLDGKRAIEQGNLFSQGDAA
jgi:hypothetical protein